MAEPTHIKYLISNERDAAWGLTATTVGRQLIEPRVPYPVGDHPHRYLFSTEKGRVLNEYHLVYISRGRGWFVSSHQKKTEIREGAMFLLFPGEWHNYAPDPETGWFESWVGFTGDTMDKRVAAGFFTPDKPVFNVGILEEVIRCYKTAVGVAREQKTGCQQVLAGLIDVLLAAAYSMDKQSSFRDLQLDNQINRAKLFMQENIELNLRAEEVAASAGLSYSRFRKLFREYTGFAPAQYMQELKISKSKELLTNTAMTCQEIAYRLGFEFPSYFNVAFRRKTGMTPNEYREMTQGKRIYRALPVGK